MKNFISGYRVIDFKIINFLMKEFDENIYIFDGMFNIKDNNDYIKNHIRINKEHSNIIDPVELWSKANMQIWGQELIRNLKQISDCIKDNVKVKYIREALLSISWAKLKIATNFNIGDNSYLSEIKREKKEILIGSNTKEQAKEIVWNMIDIIEEILRIIR